ncbi:MAG: tRNA 2-thiouridine(34) synthase MnmA, partial [Acetobacteraceae bacterium]
HKDEVRAHARRLGLAVADKAESQEICFVGAQGYAERVEAIAGLATDGSLGGDIVDQAGRKLGSHPGVHHFTVGQRRGLGLASPQPLYVTHIDASRRLVYVGPRAALQAATLQLQEVMWSHRPPADEAEVVVQQRHRDPGTAAHLQLLPHHGVQLMLGQPVAAAAPGQAAVLYAHPQGGAGTNPQDHIVLGGGVVRSRPRLPLAPAAAVAYA